MPVHDRVEALAFRGAMALPRRVQRMLAGRRVVRDGQTLDPEIQLLLRLQKLVREPAAETLPLPEGRQAIRRQSALVGGLPPVGAVRDLPVGDLPGRLYVPDGATSPGPLLVFFHGGGWIYGDLDSHDPVCRFLAEQRRRPGARGRLPARARAPLPGGVRRLRWRRTGGWSSTRRRWAPTRSGWRWAATPPGARWPRRWRSPLRRRGCRWRSSCWSTRSRTCGAAPRAAACSPRGSS